MIRNYSELSRLDSLEERYTYLRLGGEVGRSSFGFDRWVNQRFYHSREWRLVRNFVVARDLGFDLGSNDFTVRGSPQVHHMNPITLEDIEDATDNLLDPEFLISCSQRTHNAIHYGDKSLLPQVFVERSPRDHIDW